VLDNLLSDALPSILLQGNDTAQLRAIWEGTYLPNPYNLAIGLGHYEILPVQSPRVEPLLADHLLDLFLVCFSRLSD
jgi:hypothetical protein